MKLIALVATLLIALSAQSQFTKFSWDGNEIVFKTVKLEVSNADTKKIIFSGYKDCQVKLSSATGNAETMFDIKLAGYYEANAIAQSFEQKESDAGFRLIYSVVNDPDLFTVAIFYDESDKIKSIYIVVDKKYLSKNKERLMFKLEGFE